MITVYKYELPWNGMGFVMMPKGAVVLCAHSQGAKVLIWAKVDSEAPLERRSFYSLWTGAEFPQADGHLHRFSDRDAHYIGTAFVPNGLVVHVFEMSHLPPPTAKETKHESND